MIQKVGPDVPADERRAVFLLEQLAEASMPVYAYKGRTVSGQVEAGTLEVPTRDEAVARAAAPADHHHRRLKEQRGAGEAPPSRLRARPGAGARPGHLHPAVRHHGQRRPPAGAVPRHPLQAVGIAGLREAGGRGHARRGGGLDPERGAGQAPARLRHPLRQHGRRRRGGRYPRRHPDPAGHLPGEGRRR